MFILPPPAATPGAVAFDTHRRQAQEQQQQQQQQQRQK
jgi:hypothetical protein